jgi:hypothetical protein
MIVGCLFLFVVWKYLPVALPVSLESDATDAKDDSLPGLLILGYPGGVIAITVRYRAAFGKYTGY